eukprot:s937_g2.t1
MTDRRQTVSTRGARSSGGLKAGSVGWLGCDLTNRRLEEELRQKAVPVVTQPPELTFGAQLQTRTLGPARKSDDLQQQLQEIREEVTRCARALQEQESIPPAEVQDIRQQLQAMSEEVHQTSRALPAPESELDEVRRQLDVLQRQVSSALNTALARPAEPIPTSAAQPANGFGRGHLHSQGLFPPEGASQIRVTRWQHDVVDVPKGTKCQCTGQNSFSCDFNEWGYSWTECLPIEGGYCPPTCADGEVSCPGVDDYMPDGSWLGFSSPTTKCAANLDSCPCGTEAKACPGSSMRCIFKDEECPVVCGDKQKKCWITDFTQSGEYISDREICVAEDETCPCGQNTQRCPGEDICLLASEASLVCPCAESEKQCNVVDYTSSGKQTNTSVQCINKGAKCPCGANSLVCPDPNNAEENICRPKYAGTVLNSCPKACTPEQEAGGNRTCIQTHLTSTGAFRSESISCVAPANCLAGDNMQKCPSGTHIPSWKSCKDLYGAGGSNASAIASGEKQKSKVIVVLEAVKEKATEKLEDVRVLLNGELYLPKGLKSVITYKTQDTAVQGRRLTSRRASTAGAVLTLEIENEGVTSVAPVDVAQELQKQALLRFELQASNCCCCCC